jgi:hypothetical protein
LGNFKVACRKGRATRFRSNVKIVEVVKVKHI